MRKTSVLQKLFNAFSPRPDLFELVAQDGLDGLQEFLDRGGRFRSTPRNSYGTTDLMCISHYCGAEGVKLFFEKGGKVNPEARDQNGATELMYVGAHAGAPGLEVFFEKGGKVNPAAQNSFGSTELMYISYSSGAEGLKLFFENGGGVNPAIPAEATVVAKYCGGEGLCLYDEKATGTTKPAHHSALPSREHWSTNRGINMHHKR